jgi:hypothetical protein
MKKIFTILGLISAAASMNAQIVINEVYGGGGNSGAVYKNDFIELKNIGSTPITLTNATIQYAAAAGTFNQYHVLPSITLNPGQKYLIQEGAGAGGTTNLSPDFVATTIINFDGSPNSNVGLAIAAANGKVALASNNTQISGPTNTNVLDFVGFGTANMFEGAAAAAAGSNSNSVARISGDTNNNATDFAAGTPTPENSTSGTLAVSDIKNAKAGSFVKNTFVKSDEITFGADVKDIKVYNMFGQIVKSASVKENGSVNVAELAKGSYIITGTVNNEPVSQKILKD